MHNKKGVLAMMTVIALLAMLTLLMMSQAAPMQLYLTIGEKQSFLLQSYSYGEYTKDYLDDASDLALEQALYNFGQYGLMPEAFCDPAENGRDVIKCESATDFFQCNSPISSNDGYACSFVQRESNCNTLSSGALCSVDVPKQSEGGSVGETTTFSCSIETIYPSCAFIDLCGASDNNYIVWREGQGEIIKECAPTVDVALSNFEGVYKSYFRTYLAAYPSLPFTTAFDGSLLDYLKHDYVFVEDPLFVKINPAVNSYSGFTVMNPDGDIEEIDISIRSEVIIGNPDIGLTYRVDSYTSARNDIKLRTIISDLLSEVNGLDLSCVSEGTCYTTLVESSSDFEFTSGTNTDNTEEINAKPLIDGEPYKIVVHNGLSMQEEDLVIKFALQN